MKATGEVMAIDRSFEAALQKAVRSLEFGKRTLLWEEAAWEAARDIDSYPLHPNDLRLWAITAALRRGIEPRDIARKTGFDMWFVGKLMNIINLEKRLLKETLTPELMRDAKRLGFSDVQIGTLADRLPEQVRNQRQEWNIRPVYKMVYLRIEFDAETPYFYSTYESENEARHWKAIKRCHRQRTHPHRSGIEFDYSASIHPGR